MRPYSVYHGRDNEVIPILLDIHCDVADPAILDCTYNTGKMWTGLNYKVTRMDIEPKFEVDVVGDFTAMPFGDASFDVIAFDPPHLPNAAATPFSMVQQRWEEVYGITGQGQGREGDNVSPLFEPFLKEAKRVLVPGGIVIAKISDLVHNHRYQWQQVDYILTVRKIGMTPCDMMIKCDPNAGNLKSSKWEKVRHFRKCHCYWIIVRNSQKCECRKKEIK